MTQRRERPCDEGDGLVSDLAPAGRILDSTPSRAVISDPRGGMWRLVCQLANCWQVREAAWLLARALPPWRK